MESDKGSNLKPFDLEKALKGERVVTRDGREVFDIAHMPKSTALYKVYAFVGGNVETFRENGNWNGLGLHANDLFMAPKKKVIWVNLYGEGEVGAFWNTQEEADSAASSMRLGNRAYLITIEEE